MTPPIIWSVPPLNTQAKAHLADTCTNDTQTVTQACYSVTAHVFGTECFHSTAEKLKLAHTLDCRCPSQ